MLVTRSKIPQRTNSAVRKTPEGILPFDDGNDFPQWCIDLLYSSGVASYCVDLWSRFIEGQGMTDEAFYRAVINSEMLTVDELLRWISLDYARHNGFCMHVNYDATYKITEVRYVPFRDARLIHPDSEINQGKIAVYDDWGRRTRKNIKAEAIQYIDKFNPDPVVIEKQVEAAKGWENYKGQILWFSAMGKDYPLPMYDSVREDIETDSRIKSHRRKKSANGFNADYLYITGKFESDDDREDAQSNLEDNMGDTAAGNIVFVEVERKEDAPTLVKIDKTDSKGDFYLVNETAVQGNIRKRFGILPPLAGEAIQGMGISQAITEASNFMNGMTSRERRKVEETFKRVFTLFSDPAISKTKDFSIIKLQLTELPMMGFAPEKQPAA